MIRFLIVIIHFQSIITLQLQEIDVKQGVTIFNLTQKRFNQTFQLKILKEETFRYLLIELFVKFTSKSSANLVLLQQYGNAPFYDLKSQKKRILCDNFDVNGQQLSKKYHYLQLNLEENRNKESYLTILTNKTLNYQLVFTVSDIQKCPNNCNNRGQCIKGKCQCKQGFIDEDCFQSAEFFSPFIKSKISISQEQYIYTIFNTTTNYRLSLSFDLENKTKSKINIQMLVSQHHNLPYNIKNNFNQTVQDQKRIEIKLLKDNYFQSSGEFSQSFLVIKLQSQEKINYKIIIDFQTQYFQQGEELLTIILVVCFALFLIFIIISILIYCFRRQNIESQNKYQFQIPQQSDIESNRECSICLVDFITTKKALEQCVQTDCKHIFHKECLNQWLKYRQTCPICRVALK
ncbi:unnamed protein product [Paramecium sonneborni]|uniref:RING-type domain-containing protein n=1 Tax=Paramecium sonneborni TaxID=65129 RepID=A0A8S1RIQ9_9CILI|nr:unnamed protein product [Paramecium sonneborni]